MPTQLSHLWNQRHIRHLIINLVVGGAAGTVAIYVVATLLINFLDIDFLRAPYGSPDGSAILPELYIDAADTRWLGILKGAGNTLSVVLLAIALASVLGLFIGVARLTGNPIVSLTGKLYVETFRNLPLLLIMFFFAFAAFRELPQIEAGAGWSGVAYISNRGLAAPWPHTANQLWWVWVLVLAAAVVAGWVVRSRRLLREEETGESLHHNSWGAAVFLGIALVSYVALLFPIRLSFPEITQTDTGFFGYEGGNILRLGYFSALISLSLYFAAFIAEIVRGSIQAIPPGQREASSALGLSPYQQLTLVILPQALRIMIPSLNNEYQNTNKDSTLAHTIAYGEIVLISNRIVNNAGNLLQTYFFIFAMFAITNITISIVMNQINRRVQVK